MRRCYVSIWFPYLITDWCLLRRPELKNKPLVICTPSHGKLIITSANIIARQKGAKIGMTVADARAFITGLELMNDKPGVIEKLLERLAEWCIRYTPVVAIDPPDGLILDATGCSHLWRGDQLYLDEIINRLTSHGYTTRAVMADTIGAAWAIARFGKPNFVSRSSEDCLSLSCAALRLDIEIVHRLQKLGLRLIKDFIEMPSASLRRRFGEMLVSRIEQLTGAREEFIEPVQPLVLFHERLQCLEPISTATGIDIALKQLLEAICRRLQNENKGLRLAIFKCYRIDGKMEKIDIETNRPSYNVNHLFKLFELKIANIEPGLGIELFVMEAPKVEEHFPVQEKLWETSGGLVNHELSELLDRIGGKIGVNHINRYLPDEHHLPERSIRKASSLEEKSTTSWPVTKPRPLQLLVKPERIEVMAPIPDYPPMLFRYKGKLHKIIKADGPERIEQEWWILDGQHRDYYYVEDEEGNRYWLFRSGHYDASKNYQWFIHGFFA